MDDNIAILCVVLRKSAINYVCNHAIVDGSLIQLRETLDLKVNDEEINLKEYGGELRQIAINWRGKMKPTFLIRRIFRKDMVGLLWNIENMLSLEK